MRYFIPNLKLSPDLPPQEKLEEKLGGLPWGLKPEQYPICSHCGGSQSLLAQFVHNPERLDLGKLGRTLLVFQCNHNPGECPTWEGGSGANACFVLDPDELSDGLTPMPADSPPIEPEARIVDWLAQDDGISLDQVSAFYADEQRWNLPDEMRDRVYTETKLGSVPEWVQSSSEAPGERWIFIGQLSSSYKFFQKPATQNGIYIYPSSQHWVCDGPNFGDAGIGYIFLRHQSGKPGGWFFWQCG
ncbi:hypothetical protein B6N60_04795 [Richelia sinica FACHB-800]|uniref:DUF1963 domain-containing protein n=1 Tax=Richelia sinica FACHB-800 TaxID=1357546 RepID=A0A975TC68_9NOST|nr:hypothetical protein [Richelia sinica]MBD2666787.1 hypothetical protein [Richelia sinica FACHB-800]QXE26065.1 hypothetical protein B6N60_04795 [Richelia sinica FACHB-800]